MRSAALNSVHTLPKVSKNPIRISRENRLNVVLGALWNELVWNENESAVRKDYGEEIS